MMETNETRTTMRRMGKRGLAVSKAETSGDNVMFKRFKNG
jgi:hypothetical protein